MKILGIKFQLIMYIIVPLLLGVSMTLIVSYLSVLGVYDLTLYQTKKQILKSIRADMKTESSSIVLYLEEFFTRRVNDVIILTSFYSSVVDEIDNYPGLYKFSYEHNLKELLSGYDILNEKFPSDWNFKTNSSEKKSMWFSDPKIKNINELNTITQYNMEFSRRLDIFSYAFRDFNPNLVKTISLQYNTDGFYFVHPANKFSNFKSKFLENCTYSGVNQNKIDARCTSTFQNMKAYFIYSNNTGYFDINKNENFRVYIPPPVLDKNKITSSDFCSFVLNDKRELEVVICIEYYFEELTFWLLNNTMGSNEINFFLVNAFTGQIIFHPLYLQFPELQYKKSITELVFNLTDDPKNIEAINFNKSFMNSFILRAENSDGKNKEYDNSLTYLDGSYFKNNEEYIISMEKIKIQLGLDHSKSHILTAVITGPVSYYLKNPNSIYDFIKESVEMQNIYIIVLGIIFLILVFCFIYSISSPITILINNLVNHVHKIEKGDFDADVKDCYISSNLELNTLFQTFDKITKVLKYTNIDVFSTNDSTALINYSEALKLYKDMGNSKATGSLLFNIGSIHLLNNRFEEAIKCYQDSIEILKKDIEKDDPLSLERYKELSTFRSLYHKRRDGVDSRWYNSSTIHMKDVLASRLSQLASAYMFQTIITLNDKWDNVLHVILEAIDVDLHLATMQSRRVNNYLMASKAFYEMELYSDSEKYLGYANEEVNAYEQYYERVLKLNEILPEEKQTKDIPPIILTQKIMHQKGLLLKKSGQNQEACKMFTSCLETGKIYDPEIRKVCLESLKEILEKNKLIEKTPNILKLIEINFNKHNNDVVFLLDISESMCDKTKEQYALREILKFYDRYMENEDRLALIRFNHNVHVVFGLSERGKNHMYLRNTIQSSKETFKSTGETAFFSAIFEALKLFNETSLKNNRKLIIALTDGEDNSSKITYEEISELLKKSEVSLIIIGLGLNPESITDLSQLARLTKDGIFIESAIDSKIIEVAFQAIRMKFYNQTKMNLFLENLEY